MTYKEAHDLFYIKYNQIKPCLLGSQEILLYLSEAQAELQNKYHLVQYETNLNLKKGTDIYTAGTGTYDIPTDIKNIINICGKSGDNEVVLLQTSYDSIKNISKENGFPTKYAYYKFGAKTQTLEIDTYPDKDYTEDSKYQLKILYYPKLGLYTGSTGTFSDLDYSKEDWGGSFKIPEEWHIIMVEGALAKIFPERLQLYYAMIAEQLPSKPKSTDSELKYHLGI